ncbi:MAG: hypothetical protein ACJ74O_13530 [Frankiaceae bacterium]
MALDPLATTADLSARGIDISNEARSLAALAAASAAVRDAAKCPITRATSTVRIPGLGEEWLTLPGGPVRAIAWVSIDDSPVGDYRQVGDQLWRYGGWQGGLFPIGDITRAYYDARTLGGGLPAPPAIVTVTYDHGLDECPADVIDLVCSLAAASMSAQYGDHNATQVRIDDYAETRRADIVSPVTLPEATRDWLRRRFNAGGVDVVEMQT